MKKYYIFGVDEYGVARGLPADFRFHTLVIGATNTGKSTLLRTLALSSLANGEGFMVIDPHGQLAEGILKYIPRDRADDVVYISPKSAGEYGYVVKINPLRLTGSIQDPHILLDSIKKIYVGGEYGGRWGDRLERILLNAITLLNSVRNARFMDIYKVLIDKYYREDILRDSIVNEDLRTFWMEEYKDMDKNAYTAVMNKLQPLLFNAILRPVFDTEKTKINFVELMDSGKIVIVDIPVSVLSDTGTRFLGTLLVNMVYLSSFKREKRNTFHLIIDEAYKFLGGYVESILNETRKYGVFLTMAAHSLLQFDKDSRPIIQSQSHTYAIFRTDPETAKMIVKDLRNAINPEMISSLPDHYFICVNKGGFGDDGGIIKFIARTIPDDEIKPMWPSIDTPTVLLASVKRYGEPVGEVSDYTMEIQPTYIREIPRPEVTPKEYIVLTSLRFRGLNEEESLYSYLKETMGWKNSVIKSAIDKLYENGYIYRVRRSGRNHFYITDFADGLFFRIEFKGGRTGSERHRSIIRKIATDYMSLGYYTVVDDGSDPMADRPDIVVYPYIIHGDGVNPDMWDLGRAMAVEVVLHDKVDKVLTNWAKAMKLGIRNVIIVVDSRDRGIVFREAFRDEERVSKILTGILGNAPPELVKRAREVVIKIIEEREIEEHEEVEVERSVDEAKEAGEVEEVGGEKVSEEPQVSMDAEALFPEEVEELEEFIKLYAMELIKSGRYKTLVSAMNKRGLNVDRVGVTYDGRVLVMLKDGRSIVYGKPDEEVYKMIERYKKRGWSFVVKNVRGKKSAYLQKRVGKKYKSKYLGLVIPEGSEERLIELKS